MRILLAFIYLLILSNCTFVQERYPSLPPGPYRAVLKLEDNFSSPNPKGKPLPEKMNLEFEEVTDGELPFTFQVTYENDSLFHIDITNGDEQMRIPSQDIYYGRDLVQGRDTLRIDFPIYDSYIAAYHEVGVIEGVWVVNYRDQYRIPFVAEFGKDHRFTQLRKTPAADLSGKWAMIFTDDNNEYPGLAEFTQEGNLLKGTIRTEVGDYRYLEGTVQDKKLYLSVFDGSHAFLFEGLIKDDGSLQGSFRSGRHYIATFTANRDDKFQLADPNSLTRLQSDEPFNFRFPDAEGKVFSLGDPAFKGKVKIIQIMGTWCPNCYDETSFLKDFRQENPTEDLAFISLAFERYGPDDERSKAAIRGYEERMQLGWPILLAGSSDKKAASQALPMLSEILSFPTLLLVNQNNQIVDIHTGFNGPATSVYAQFKSDFTEKVNSLLAAQ